MERTRTMAMTPYNFIPFPKNIVYRYEAFSDLPAHNKKDAKEEPEALKTGWIDYQVETLSPLFIGNGQGEFFNIDGDYKIPGSTMKGKIRANAEILSHAQPQFIDDQKFWYRGLADKSIKLREEYIKTLKNIPDSSQIKSIEASVRAGYIQQKGSKYRIIPAKQDEKGCYFQRIKESRLRNMKINSENCEEFFMYKKIRWNDINKLKAQRNTREIDSLLRADKRNNRADNGSLKAFKPYSKKVYYKLDEKGNVVDISTHSQGNWKEGYLTNSSNLGNKQVHYLFFEADKTSEIPVSRDVVAQFKVNVEYRNSHEKRLFDVEESAGKTIRNMGNIDENLKPIFYQVKGDSGNEVKVIGFTPYLKIPYRYSICARHSQIAESKIDYVQGLFGMTEPKAYKSRLIFDNLDLESPDVKTLDDIRLPLMNPKPTSFQLYIKQTTDRLNELKNYNDEDFELNGYKFYYLKETTHEARINENQNGNKSEAYLSILKPIENAVFKGKIHFKNLHDDELGLLLMALEPFKGSKDSLGQGKPFGFGKVKIRVDKICFQQENSNEKSANLIEEIQKIVANEPIGSVREEVDTEKYKELFKEKIETLADKRLFTAENETLEAMLYSKMVEVKSEAYQYMELGRFKEREVLPSIEELSGKSVKADKVRTKKEVVEIFGKKIQKSEENFAKNADQTVYETYVTRNKRILVLSKTLSDEKKIENVMKAFNFVEFKSISEVKNIAKYDMVIFNNYDGSDEAETKDLEKIMQKNENKAYLYFNTKNKRFNGWAPQNFHYSSTMITLFNAIIELSRFSEKLF